MSRATKSALVMEIENCAAKALYGTAGRSTKKTEKLHGPIEAHSNSLQIERPVWEHYKEITGNSKKLKVDMFAEGNKKCVAILVKVPIRNLAKNRKNTLVHTWGEAIRIAQIRRGYPKPLDVLSVVIHPTIDISANQKGNVSKIKSFVPDSDQTYQDGYRFINSAATKHRHVGLSFDFNPHLPSTTLTHVHNTFTSHPAGKRISISTISWSNLDAGIRWLLNGLN